MSTIKRGRVIKVVCTSCGCSDIERDAAAKWSVEAQTWELSACQDTVTCNSCGASGHVGHMVKEVKLL